MHILTGLLVTAFLGRKRSAQTTGEIPGSKMGPVRVVHAIKGRLRLQVPAVNGLQEADLPGIATLKTLNGIQTVRFTPVTGSILIHYHPDQLEPMLIWGAVIKLLGLEDEMDKSPTPAILKEMKAFGRGLNRSVLQETHGFLDGRAILIILMLIIGVRKLYVDRWASIPAGATLIWWALNSIGKLDD